jgi:MFS family permease
MQQADQSIFERRWKLLLLLLWLATCAFLIYSRWSQIQWFSLGDTDDNLRMMQVRDLLRGQDWYDLRQYRLNPPEGANIHWSHLVDLPIAAIILLARPFIGGAAAEMAATAIAPLLPLGVLMAGLAVTARRLIAPAAWILGASIFLCFVTAMTYFMPLRIDHHGWQLACLAWLIAGLVDPKAFRGGATAGLATAFSFVIGIEMLPWLAIAGACIGLRWILAAEEAQRMRGYAVALSGGIALGYFAFTSYDNAVPRCDALTPVWFSTMIVTGISLYLASLVPAEKRTARIVLTALAGIVIALFYALMWPDCVGRPEQVTPEMQRLWLDNISEAKPIYTRSWVSIASVSVLLVGLVGNFWSLWRSRETKIAGAWLPIALLSLASALMLFFQARVAAAALLLSAPGAAALGWYWLPKMRAHSSVVVRTFGFAAVFLLVSGLWVQLAAGYIPSEKESPGMKRVNKANVSCPTLPSMRPIAKLPKTTILTFVDLGPRLITVTHHNAIAGPYHRNGEAVLDIHKAFRGTPEDALAVMKKHGATLLLLCPGMSESTIYKSENPQGFYMQLVGGKVPDWLAPVPLPERSPFKLWRLSSTQ